MDNEISIQMSARSADDARELFELCLTRAATGVLLEGGELIMSPNPQGGGAMLYTFPPRH